VKILPSTRISLAKLQDLTEAKPERIGGAEKKPERTSAEAAASFGNLLSNSIQEVNRLQQQADLLGTQAASGELRSVSTAIVAMEKAQLALQLTAQVRNKVIEAYREIMSMPI
jgi:flagellar hook-basal body complex protein FliE